MGVSAVVMNVTVTNTTASSFLTVFPAAAQRPVASNLNWVPGQTVPNRVPGPGCRGCQSKASNPPIGLNPSRATW
jgi:hypothetical protein